MNDFPERGLLLIETHFDWYVHRKKFKAVWELSHGMPKLGTLNVFGRFFLIVYVRRRCRRLINLCKSLRSYQGDQG